MTDRRWVALARLAAVAALLCLEAAWAVCTAHADPAPPPVPPGYAACGDRLIPADPRLDVQNPLGAIMYRQLLQQMCGGSPQPR